MHHVHNGRSIWYGTPDAPAPEETVPLGSDVVVVVGLRPVDASNRVDVRYRINQGTPETAAAAWLRNEPGGNAQYFRVRFPDLRAGDQVEYVPICRCAGRQLPSEQEAEGFTSAFRVTEASRATSAFRDPSASRATPALGAREAGAKPAARSPHERIPKVRDRGKVEVDARRDAVESLPEAASSVMLSRAAGSDGLATVAHRGYGSLLEVARMGRGAFRRRIENDLDEIESLRLHRDATLYERVLRNAILAVRPDADEDPSPELPANMRRLITDGHLWPRGCRCDDCESAVSPAAYLADLIEYVLRHMTDSGDQLTLSRLEQLLHVPFGRLPTSCDAVNEPVRRVRLCIEGLRSFLGSEPAAGPAWAQPSLLIAESDRLYREYLQEAYRLLLFEMGTTTEELRLAQPAADEFTEDELVDPDRLALASRLGVAPGRLPELILEDSELSELRFEEIFGLRSTRDDPLDPSPEPLLQGWRDDYLTDLWRAEDALGDGFGDDRTVAIIDPDCLSSDHLRSPLAENAAFQIWEARRETVHQQREELTGVVGAGLDSAIVQELNTPIDTLREWYWHVRGGETSDEVVEEIEELGLPLGHFQRLMEIEASEIDDALHAEAVRILAGLRKLGLYPEWIEEEMAQEIELGPEHFWLPLGELDAPPQWLSSLDERVAWESALARRYERRPLIDPHWLSPGQIVVGSSSPGGEAALTLWEARGDWASETRAALTSARDDAATTVEALESTLLAADLGFDGEAVREVIEAEARGQDIGRRLHQFGFDRAEFDVVTRMVRRADSNSAVSDDDWDLLVAALLRCAKGRRVVRWRREEQDAGIFLDPAIFDADADPPSEESPADQLLGEIVHARRWLDRLRARSEQLVSVVQALRDVIAGAEEHALPILRESLVVRSTVDAPKNETLTDLLLIDMRSGGCQVTTRVSQAIETLHTFIRNARRESLPPPLDSIALDAPHFDREWRWLGSYESWRSLLLAYLYPEVVLQPTTRRWQSFGFVRLVEAMGLDPTPEKACRAAGEYARYMRDVASLEVQATCRASTPVPSNDARGCAGSLPHSPLRVHAFAVARASGRVYTAAFDADEGTADTLDTWTPVPIGEDVVEILGATAHDTPTERLILVFCKTRVGGAVGVRLAARAAADPAGEWSTVNLAPPPRSGGDFTAAVVQKHPDHSAGSGTDIAPLSAAGPGDSQDRLPPTTVAFGASTGEIFIRALNHIATDWDSDGWHPVFGSALDARIRAVEAWLQLSPTEYVLVVLVADANTHSSLWYRYFSTRGVVRSQLQAWSSPFSSFYRGEGYVGGFAWPRTTDFYVVVEDVWHGGGSAGPSTAYGESVLFFTTNVGSQEDHQFTSLENFISDAHRLTGVDLAAYQVEFHWVFYDEDEPEGNGASGGGHGIRDNVISVLLNHDWHEFHPPALDFLRRSWAGLDSVGYGHGTYGQIKILDRYVRQISGRRLIDVIEDLVNHETVSYSVLDFEENWDLHGEISTEGLPFQITDRYSIVPGGGEGLGLLYPGTSVHESIVMQTGRGALRLRVNRQGDALVLSRPRPITPESGATTGILSPPAAASTALQQRRAVSEEDYTSDWNEHSLLSVRSYLEELYRAVPMHLALELHRNGYFREARDWFATVYHDLAPAGQQKIDYGLVLEETFSFDFDREEDWIQDPGNVHAIARQRRGAYTRATLLAMARCFLDEADELFTNDTSESVAIARELYDRTLRLLDAAAFRSPSDACGDIIGTLEIDLPGVWTPQVDRVRLRLATIADPAVLRDVVEEIHTVGRSARPAAERVGRMVAVVEKAAHVDSSTIGGAIEKRRWAEEEVESALLAESETALRLSRTMRSAAAARSPAVPRSATAVRSAIVMSASMNVPERPNSTVPAGRMPRASAILTDRPHEPDDNGPRPVADDVISVRPPNGDGNGILFPADLDYRVTPAIGVSFDFCIPQNPLLHTLRMRAEGQLDNIRNCRNVVGMPRQLEPYAAPIGIGSGFIGTGEGPVRVLPTYYRFDWLIARAKELAALAQQSESAFLAALEKAKNEALVLLKAKQGVELARARVESQRLQVVVAHDQIGLANLQQASAELRYATFDEWIAAGPSEYERGILTAYQRAGAAQQDAAIAQRMGSVAQALMSGAMTVAGAQGLAGRFAAYSAVGTLTPLIVGAAFDQSAAQVREARAQTDAQVRSLQASWERREQQWQLERSQAAMDVRIGEQQIAIARNQLAVVEQEHRIAHLEAEHTSDVLNFLEKSFLDEELYRWMSGVLQGIFRYVLNQATAVALLAERALSFERQTPHASIIRSDYWQSRREGLTSSAQFIRSITELEQQAFETKQRKLQLSATFDLAQQFPFEFEQFRQTGRMVFQFPLRTMFDVDFPGHYLRLISRVGVSIVAMVPPTRGIRATLTSSGLSRVVVAEPTFHTVTLRRAPEQIALVSPMDVNRVVPLTPEDNQLLGPFEGNGVEMLFELSLPKAANPIDYDTIATALVTIDYTALNSFSYRQHVLAEADAEVQFERAFSFRQTFADPWYDLHNPDQTEEPMVVRFETGPGDFPPNLDNVRLRHVGLYFASDAGLPEIPVEYLRFTPAAGIGTTGGPARTVERIISTRSSALSWTSMIGNPPVGQWELSLRGELDDGCPVRRLFEEEQLRDMLLVLSCAAERPPVY